MFQVVPTLSRLVSLPSQRWLSRRLPQFVRRAGICILATVFTLGCAADPVVPPAELSPIEVKAKLNKVWSADIGKSGRNRFSPFVDESAVFVASQSGHVASYAKKSGKLRWRVDLKSTLGSGVAGADGRVFVSGGDGVVYALDAKTGESLWTKIASSEVLVPVAAGFGAVVVRSADGRVIALEPDTGEERWTLTYTPPALTLNGYSRPLLLDGGVLIGLDDGRLLALDLSNGRAIWETVLSVATGRSEVERLVDIDANIRVDDSAIYVVNYQGKLARIEPSRGQIIWSIPFSSTAGIALLDEHIAVVDDEDFVHLLEKDSGRELWSQEGLRGRRLSPPQVTAGNIIMVGDLEGYLHLLSKDDGTIIGRYRMSKHPIAAEAAASDEIIYLQATDGTVSALRAGR